MIPTNFKIALGAFILVIAFIFGYQVSHNSWQSKWDKAVAEASENQLKAVDEAVKKYKDRIAEMEKSNDETGNKLDVAAVDAAAASDAADGLQQSFRDSLCQPSERPASTPSTRELAAIATDKRVQAVVFERVSRRAVEYAKIADENRIRGLACEANYQRVQF